MNEATTDTVTTGTTTLVPHLTCRNAVEAADFYKKALGATLVGMMNTPDGRVMHASMEINGATFYMVDEFPEYMSESGTLSPDGLGGSPVTLHLNVPDCDAVFNKAVAAGCAVVMPLDDMFWGDRYGLVTDPYGHKWSISTTLRTVSPEELPYAVVGFHGGNQ